MSELTDLTLAEASQKLNQRSVSAVEFMEATFDRIRQTERLVHAFASLDKHQAMAGAARADDGLRNGATPSPLYGIAYEAATPWHNRKPNLSRSRPAGAGR